MESNSQYLDLTHLIHCFLRESYKTLCNKTRDFKLQLQPNADNSHASIAILIPFLHNKLVFDAKPQWQLFQLRVAAAFYSIYSFLQQLLLLLKTLTNRTQISPLNALSNLVITKSSKLTSHLAAKRYSKFTLNVPPSNTFSPFRITSFYNNSENLGILTDG